MAKSPILEDSGNGVAGADGVTARDRGMADHIGRNGPVRTWAVVAILTMLTLVSLIDRQVFALIVDPIRAELHITDVEFGWLVGPAFIVFYNLVLFPMAWAVDRFNRKYLLTAAVLLWSTMTVASGFASSLTELIVLRAGLAIGEAAVGPAAISLLGDMFVRERRPLPTSIFVSGSAVGTTGANFFVAAILQMAGSLVVTLPSIGVAHPWRLTLIAVGLPGFILAAMLALTLREPSRQAAEPAGVSRQTETLIVHLKANRGLYARIAFASGLLLTLAISINVWGPAYLIRRFGISPVEAGYALGGVAVFGAIAGPSLAGYIVQRVALVRGAVRSMVDLLVCVALIALPATCYAVLADTVTKAVIGFGVALLFLTATFATASQLVQFQAPATMRGRVLAVMLFVMFLLGSGIGPVAVPMLAGRFFGGDGGLGPALGALACGTCALVLLALAFPRSWLPGPVGPAPGAPVPAA